MNSIGHQDRVVIANIAFVVDFDQHISITTVQHPIHGTIGGAQYGGFILQSLVLAEIEQTHDGDHAQFVRLVENTPQAREIVWPQLAILRYRRVVPRLIRRISLWTASL